MTVSPLSSAERTTTFAGADFITLATTAGLRAGDAEAALESILQPLRGLIDDIAVPDAIALTKETRKLTTEVFDICRRRIEGIA